MKAFRKWRINWNTTHSTPPLPKEAWKAALKWALGNDDGPCDFNLCVVRRRIEKELEGE